jgi:hypothetical protein
MELFLRKKANLSKVGNFLKNGGNFWTCKFYGKERNLWKRKGKFKKNKEF